MAQVADIEIKNNFDEVEEAFREKIEAWLLAVGEDAASTAAEIPNFPVDTGRLRNSITAVSEGHQSQPNKYSGEPAEPEDYQPHGQPEPNSVYIGTNVDYAIYHELGTSRGIPAKHFIQFGASAHARKYKQMLEEQLKQ